MSSALYIGVDRRKHRRFPTSEYVKAELTAGSISAKMVDLSLSGLRLRLSIPFSAFGRSPIRHVTVPDIGTLDVEVVWSTDSTIGLKFINTASAARRVVGYLRTKGLIENENAEV